MTLIIQPAHHIPATKVKNWKEIKAEAEAVDKFVSEGEYHGYWKECFAIHHAQVSETPKDFFVINRKCKEVLKDMGSWCIINPRIIHESFPIYFPEGCMSFPFRKPKQVECFDKITVEYYTLSMGFFLRKRIKDLVGLSAIIMQHEILHGKGENIYNL